MKNNSVHPLRIACAIAFLFCCCFPVGAQHLDPTFASPLVLREARTAVIKKAARDKVYIAGDMDYHGETQVANLIRLTPSGYLDTSFKPILPDELISDFEILPNGNIAVVIESSMTGVNTIYLLAVDGRRIANVNIYEGYATSIKALPDNSFLVGLLNGSGGGTLLKFSKSAVLDESFQVSASGPIYDVELQGTKILIAGLFNKVTGKDNVSMDRTNIARLNVNASVDGSFNANTTAAGYGRINGLRVQTDGKVILLNRYVSNTLPPNRAIRLNADGSPDAAFNTGYLSSLSIEEADVNADKITVATRTKLVRVNMNGSVDPSFQEIPYPSDQVRMTVLSDNSIVATNYKLATYGVAKFNSGGINTNAYYANISRNGIINTIDKTDVSIYIGGDFFKINNHFTRNVARLNLNGTVLTKFKVTADHGIVKQIDGFSNARALINTDQKILRLDHDGKVDLSFKFVPFDGLSKITKFIVQNDGKILVGAPAKIFRINSNGSKDASFNAGIGALVAPGNVSFFDFDLDQSTGKIIFVGVFAGQPSPATSNMKRLNPNGSIDPAFQSQLVFDQSYHGVERVLFLDNLQVITTSLGRYYRDGIASETVKLNADGSVNEEFFDNYAMKYDWVGSYDQMYRFGQRVMLGTYYFYSDWFADQVIFKNGATDDNFMFPTGFRLRQVTGFYSENNRELYITGRATTDSSPRTFQLIKVIYDQSDAFADATSRDSADELISFYPNPVKHTMQVIAPEGSMVNIFTMMGEEKQSARVIEGTNIDVSALPSGRYVIQVSTGGKVLREQFMKE